MLVASLISLASSKAKGHTRTVKLIGPKSTREKDDALNKMQSIKIKAQHEYYIK